METMTDDLLDREALAQVGLNADKITQEDRKVLRQPFAASAIRWLPIGGLTRNGAQKFQPHINASLVFERFGEVDPSWELIDVKPEAATPDDPLGMKHGGPHRAWIKINGVVRSGRGVAAKTEPAKSAESDAIKRAALAFEVGAYLRAFENVFLAGNSGANFSTTNRNGNAALGYLTDAGNRALRAHYERVTSAPEFVARYGEPVEYGDIVVIGEEMNDESAASEQEQQMEERPSDSELDVLLLLTKYNGRSTPEDVVRETLQQHAFTKCLARVLRSVTAALLIDADDAEKLREVAITAAEGDKAKLHDLAAALEELEAIAETKQPGEVENDA